MNFFIILKLFLFILLLFSRRFPRHPPAAGVGYGFLFIFIFYFPGASPDTFCGWSGLGGFFLNFFCFSGASPDTFLRLEWAWIYFYFYFFISQALPPTPSCGWSGLWKWSCQGMTF
jgi:hypothetical protein